MTTQLVSTLELLDFELTLNCGLPNCHHDRPPAHWRSVLSCGCRNLACDPCKERGDQNAGLVVDVWYCRTCGAIRSGRIGDHRTYEPLP